MDDRACRVLVLTLLYRATLDARKRRGDSLIWCLSDEAKHWADLIDIEWPPPGL